MLINLRNALMTGKRTPTAKDYVQDGLVAMWDGIENAGWGTHDASATVWKDLIENKHPLTLYGSTAFGSDYCQINGQNNAGAAYNYSEIAASSGGYTVHSVLIVRSSTNYAARPYSIRSDNLSSNGVEKYVENGTANGYFVGNGSSYYSQSGLYNTPINVAFSEDLVIASNGRCTAYINGTQVASFFAYPPMSLPRVVLGNAMSITGNRGCNIDVHNFATYSRALTADEIARNYAIDKARFNLP